MSAASVIIAIYIIGWFVTSVIFTRYWYRRFGMGGTDRLEGAAWGSLAGAIWFVALPLLLVGRVAKEFS